MAVTPKTMTVWVHCTETTYFSRIAPTADEYARGGWELIGVLPKGAERALLVFRKKKKVRVKAERLPSGKSDN